MGIHRFQRWEVQGKDSDIWHDELVAQSTKKISRDDFELIKEAYQENKGCYRQLWLGE